MRILVAEDETIIRLDLRALLEQAGYEVCGEARDGVEAVELARELEPDLAVMDVKMPRLDGIDAARRILDDASSGRRESFLTMGDRLGAWAAGAAPRLFQAGLDLVLRMKAGPGRG